MHDPVDLPQPDPDLPHLAEVVPSVLAALGTPGFANTLSLPDGLSGACVLLIDGLGAELLDAHRGDAPVLAGLRARTLTVGFPSTTAAGIAALGTGCSSGGHGLVGYTFRVPGAGVLNALSWRPHPFGPDLRDSVVPEQLQPMPTTFERAAAAGFAVSVISDAEHGDSGLTRAVLRGGRYVGVLALGDLAAQVGAALAGGGFCYGYHRDLDLLGHVHGPGSPAWRMQLRQIDRLVESIVERLPPGALLAVVADHGMVGVDTARVVDADATEGLLDGVAALGGEPRARHVYAVDGAVDDVLITWREILGDRARVLAREEAIAAGWFGGGGPADVRAEVRPRIGDVVAAALGTAAVVRRRAEPMESALVGHHGSLTSAEQRVPLLVAHG